MTTIERDALAKMLKDNPDLGLDLASMALGIDLGSSDAEATFDAHWQRMGGPPLVKEYVFHQGRKWRFDRADPASQVAIEIEGGVWQGKGHANPYRFEEDCEKYNAAARQGWILQRFTPQMIERDPAGCLLPVIALVTLAEEGE